MPFDAELCFGRSPSRRYARPHAIAPANSKDILAMILGLGLTLNPNLTPARAKDPLAIKLCSDRYFSYQQGMLHAVAPVT